MTWLLELLFDSIRTMCAQFVVDMMDMATGVFTDLLSCNLSLFEELFPVAGSLYRNAVLPMSIALLIVICAWQLLKTMFGGLGTNAEEPVELVGRSMMCLFLVLNCKKVVDYLLDFAGTPYSWIVGTDMEIESFSGFVSASELAAAALGIDTMSLQLLLLIMQLVVAWNYFKLLFAVAERYVLLGVFSYTAPLAFASGGSKATNNILANWAKMFGGQIILIVLDAWGLKMYLSAYGSLLASRHGFTKFFVGCLCLVGFCKIMQKLDSYLASLGLNLGRTNPGMSGTALAVMAGRMFGRAAGGYRETAAGSTAGTSGNGKKSGTGTNGLSGEGGCADGSDPIPMSGRKGRDAAAKGSMREEKTDNGGTVEGSYSSRADSQRPEKGYKKTEHGQNRKNGRDAGERQAGSFTETGNMPGNIESGRKKGRNADNYSRSSDQKKKQATVQRNHTDAGIGAAYEEETWASMEEEAAAMDAAIEMMRAEGSDMPQTAGDFDTGILSSGKEDAGGEDEIHPSDIGYDPGMWESVGSDNGQSSGSKAEAHTVGNRGEKSGLVVDAGMEPQPDSMRADGSSRSVVGGGDHNFGTDGENIVRTGIGRSNEEQRAGTGIGRTDEEQAAGNGIGRTAREQAARTGKEADAGGSERTVRTNRRQAGAGKQTGSTQDGYDRNVSEGLEDGSQADINTRRAINSAGGKGTPSRFVRNGKLYLSTDRYEAPEIPYQMEKRNGADFYTVPENAATGGVQATLQENGSIRYSHGKKGGWEPKLKKEKSEALSPDQEQKL